MSALSHPVLRKTQLGVFMLLVSVIAVQAGCAEEFLIRKDASKIDLDSISSDVMKGLQNNKRGAVVLWFAPQYVEALGRSSGRPIAEIQEVKSILRPYNMFFVLSKTLDTPNFQRIETPEEIRRRIRFIDQYGNVHIPLTNEQIAEDARAVATALARGFERGSRPKQTIVMFGASDNFGSSLADAAKKGSFQIQIGELSIKWQLPLGSVVNRSN